MVRQAHEALYSERLDKINSIDFIPIASLSSPPRPAPHFLGVADWSRVKADRVFVFP